MAVVFMASRRRALLGRNHSLSATFHVMSSQSITSSHHTFITEACIPAVVTNPVSVLANKLKVRIGHGIDTRAHHFNKQAVP
eukprot:scaffold265916_cov19-Prasinocladus_malaysianus.AAC.1